MSDKKITDLTSLANADSGDTLAIVDVSVNTTKKVTVAALVGGMDGAITTAKLADASVTNAKVAAGFAVQIVSTSSSAVATGTTTIPYNDNIPQITEGTEFMTLVITPKSATNILVVEASSLVANSGADYIAGAVFQDATTNALAAGSIYSNDANSTRQLSLVHSMVAGTTSATTFRIRLGPTGANTITFNGSGGARKFGAITKSFIKITEYKS